MPVSRLTAELSLPNLAETVADAASRLATGISQW
jgi:hypothetical protein